MSRKLYCGKCGKMTKHQHLSNIGYREEYKEERLGIYQCDVCAEYRSGPAIE